MPATPPTSPSIQFLQPLDPLLNRTERPWGWFETLVVGSPIPEQGAQLATAPALAAQALMAPVQTAPAQTVPVQTEQAQTEPAAAVGAALPGPGDQGLALPYLVKQIWIKPGCRISLQRHRHRCEHWLVLAGSGLLECGDDRLEATAGTSLFVPSGALHRASAAALGLLILEVQRGDQLREDDIERIADDYGRVVG